MPVSMFDRYGGFASVSKIVMSFYDRALDSDIIGEYFENSDMKALIDHQTKFISSLMGGPASYSDEVLRRVHAKLGINQEAFDEMTALLTETLEDFDIDPDDIREVMDGVGSRAKVIVTT